ncbi:nuclear transport factor 2 family protein [Natronorubrum sp. FCH18a]|uniref:nuclear transport factor 2 family protein n=1 Tax=Natronorubrum sp. FCH18a TaxID=3447018 RepID=UPI003F51099D
MELEERVQRLEDRENIKKLKYEYARHLDNRSWKQWTKLFTPDAQCTFSGLGTFHGREELLSLARETVAPAFEYSAHVMHHPEIEIDEDTATGRWLVDIFFALQDDEIAGWRQGRYTDSYQRVDGEWKHSSVSHTFDARNRFDYGLSHDDRWGELIEFGTAISNDDG